MNVPLMKVADALLLFISFVGIPAIAGAIGFAAWKGWPAGFTRSTYMIVFWGLGLASGVLIVFAQRMMPDEIWHQILQEVLGALGLLLAGVSTGCAVGIFTYRHRPPPSGSDE